MRQPCCFLVLLGALIVATLPAQAVEDPETRYSYSIKYRVTIEPDDPTIAHIRWEFAGIDEVEYARLRLGKRPFFDFTGSGEFEQKGSEIIWRPGGPYAHLEYKVQLRYRRSKNKGYDSYATDDWAITRAKALFPKVSLFINREIEPDPVPRCELLFRLPAGWKVHTMMERLGSYRFRPPTTGRFIDRPKGWFALGRLDVISRQMHGTRVTVAKVKGSKFDGKGLLRLYEKALPLMMGLLAPPPPRFLVVSAPDPMWHGGISGQWSYYVHDDRPLRTPDRTSPPLHELFHVLAPFRPNEDGEWITEGLAEYYSLEVQRRIGVLKERDFQRGLRLFERYGEWNVNLTARTNLAATNNSAPLVIHAIDRAIRQKTAEERSLDDVVRELVERTEKVSTAGFLRAVNSVSGHNFTPFFQRHVYAGSPPQLPELEDARETEARRRQKSPG